jgi:nucleotide-binding universal stress UspA family protein
VARALTTLEAAPSGEGRRGVAIRRILVAVDLTSADGVVARAAFVEHDGDHPSSRAARRLVDEAALIARALGASLEIAYVRKGRARDVARPRNGESDALDDWIDDELAKLAGAVNEAGVACTTTSLQGSVRRTLVAHVKKMNPDLVVLGSHKRWHGLARSAEHILLHRQRRVLVVPTGGVEA